MDVDEEILKEILKKFEDLKKTVHAAGIDDANELIKATKRAVVGQFVNKILNKYLEEE